MPDVVTKADLRDFESRMTIKLGAIMVAGLGILAAIIKLI